MILRARLCGRGTTYTYTEGVIAHNSAARHMATCLAAASRRESAVHAVQVSCLAGPHMSGLLIQDSKVLLAVIEGLS